MAYDQKDMSGILFRNDRKEKDTHPDYTGNARIDGHEFWISAWIKTSSKGTKFMSLSFKSKEEQVRQERVAGSGKTPVDLDDEIPW